MLFTAITFVGGMWETLKHLALQYMSCCLLLFLLYSSGQSFCQLAQDCGQATLD